MDTHENELPDEELPGHGILDADFARKMLKTSEENGLLVWDENEGGSYRPSARFMLMTISASIAQKAHEIDPDADMDEILAAIFASVPFVAGGQFVRVDSETGETLESREFGEPASESATETVTDWFKNHRDAHGSIPLPEHWDVPDFIPEDM